MLVEPKPARQSISECIALNNELFRKEEMLRLSVSEMLYSDSKEGIREEITEFKQEPYVTYPRVEIIEHQNGHCD